MKNVHSKTLNEVYIYLSQIFQWMQDNSDVHHGIRHEAKISHWTRDMSEFSGYEVRTTNCGPLEIVLHKASSYIFYK